MSSPREPLSGDEVDLTAAVEAVKQTLDTATLERRPSSTIDPSRSDARREFKLRGEVD